MKKIIPWVFLVITATACNKTNLGQVEVTAVIIEKLPASYQAPVALNFGIYDDIGPSFLSKTKTVQAWPASWDISYQVPNFPNLYSVAIDAVSNGTTMSAAYFNINFSDLHNQPATYVYESPDKSTRVILVLRWY